MFGTAVGAGILFLPIRAGLEGFWPLILMGIIIGPLVYLAHRALGRFILSSSKPNAELADVVTEHFGNKSAIAISFLYFFAFFPPVLIYGSAITNTVDSFMVNQLAMEAWPRWLLSGVLITAMVGVIMLGQKLMLKITAALVYPLIAILFGFSVYLIPDWSMEAMSTDAVPAFGDFMLVVFMAMPMLIFSFNHSPAVSYMAQAQRNEHGEHAEAKSDAILKGGAILLVIFVMFFVFSCVLSLTPAQLLEAKEQNLPVLSYLANVHGSPVIAIVGPLVAFLAIFSSFFGHLLGAKEGLSGLLRKACPEKVENIDAKKFDKGLMLFFYLSTWAITVYNPSVLGMCEALGAPFIIAMLFLVPMFAINKVPAMAKYRGKVSNVVVTVTGIGAILAVLIDML